MRFNAHSEELCTNYGIKKGKHMEKYSWEFNDNADIWNNKSHASIEECIAEAKEELSLGGYYTDDIPTKVYIGENVEFVPSVDAEIVLDYIQEQASEFAGEIGSEWDAYNHKKHNEIDELSEQLSIVVIEWMKKYGYAPNFYAVEHVKSYPLN